MIGSHSTNELVGRENLFSSSFYLLSWNMLNHIIVSKDSPARCKEQETRPRQAHTQKTWQSNENFPCFWQFCRESRSLSQLVLGVLAWRLIAVVRKLSFRSTKGEELALGFRWSTRKSLSVVVQSPVPLNLFWRFWRTTDTPRTRPRLPNVKGGVSV